MFTQGNGVCSVLYRVMLGKWREEMEGRERHGKKGGLEEVHLVGEEEGDERGERKGESGPAFSVALWNRGIKAVGQ